ncbi:hypothetical protein BDZ89DRAFT_906220, partial [Hymenopellis radicata]
TEKDPELADPVADSGSLFDVLSGGRAGINLENEIRNKYDSDPAFRAILKKPKDFRNFDVEDGLVYIRMADERKLLCIPGLFLKERSIREIVIDEAHSLLAHLGSRKTLLYLREYVWWKT